MTEQFNMRIILFQIIYYKFFVSNYSANILTYLLCHINTKMIYKSCDP